LPGYGLQVALYPGALIGDNATTRGDRYQDNISGGVIGNGDPIGLRLSGGLLTLSSNCVALTILQH
jgi:hypothetical protein